MQSEFTPVMIAGRADVPDLQLPVSNETSTLVFILSSGQACPWLPSFVNAAPSADVHVLTTLRGACQRTKHASVSKVPGLRNGNPCAAIVFFLLTLVGQHKDSRQFLFLSRPPARYDLASIQAALLDGADFVPYHRLEQAPSCFPTAFNQSLVDTLALNHIRVPVCVHGPRTHDFKISRDSVNKVLRHGAAIHQLYRAFVVSKDGKSAAKTCGYLRPLWGLLFEGFYRPPRLECLKNNQTSQHHRCVYCWAAESYREYIFHHPSLNFYRAAVHYDPLWPPPSLPPPELEA